MHADETQIHTEHALSGEIKLSVNFSTCYSTKTHMYNKNISNKAIFSTTLLKSMRILLQNSTRVSMENQ